MPARRIAQLDDGAFTIDQARLLSGPGGRGVTVKAALRPLLVETDDGEVVLVDPSMAQVPDPVAGLHERLGEPRLEAALADRGLRPRDVTLVVVTHLHYDHAANVDSFPSAEHVVQAAHLDFAHDCPNPWPIGFCDDAWRRVDWTEVRGEREVADGVTVRPTPGHVPGHQSVLVERPGGLRPACFPGDAAPLPRNVERGVLPGIVFDADEARRSLEWIRSLDAELYFYHAPKEMDVGGPWDRDDEATKSGSPG